jgi:hypothetical protein
LPHDGVGDGGEAGDFPAVYRARVGQIGLQEQRRGGEHVRQRRVDVDGLQAEVAGAQCGVPNRQVRPFVKGDGSVAHLRHAEAKKARRRRRGRGERGEGRGVWVCGLWVVVVLIR